MATQAEKRAQAEADRRANMTPEEREAEDQALLAQMEHEEAQRNAGRSGQGQDFDQSREAVTARLAKANADRRAQEATETGIVARGRTLFTEAGQTEPHMPGSTVALTPAEKSKLVASGHIQANDGNIVEPEGPRTFDDKSLIQGHAKGQGVKPEAAPK